MGNLYHGLNDFYLLVHRACVKVDHGFICPVWLLIRDETYVDGLELLARVFPSGGDLCYEEGV